MRKSSSHRRISQAYMTLLIDGHIYLCETGEPKYPEWRERKQDTLGVVKRREQITVPQMTEQTGYKLWRIEKRNPRLTLSQISVLYHLERAKFCSYVLASPTSTETHVPVVRCLLQCCTSMCIICISNVVMSKSAMGCSCLHICS